MFLFFGEVKITDEGVGQQHCKQSVIVTSATTAEAGSTWPHLLHGQKPCAHEALTVHKWLRLMGYVAVVDCLI